MRRLRSFSDPIWQAGGQFANASNLYALVVNDPTAYSGPIYSEFQPKLPRDLSDAISPTQPFGERRACKMSITMRERLIGILGIIVVSSLPLVFLLSFVASAQPGAPDPTKAATATTSPEATTQPPTAQKVWRQQMAKTPFPKPGCYTSSYPSTQWQEVPCSTAAPRPHPQNGDYSAQVVSGSLSSAMGSFEVVSGATGEQDSKSAPNHFSLQLNTNRFNSPLCDQGNPNCAWQQFIYDDPGNVYIQYWLIRNKQPCPSQSWTYYDGSAGAPGCYINGNQATPRNNQAITDLAKLSLTGTSSSSEQSAMLEASDGSLWGTPDGGDPLGIGSQWTNAEFNIVGWCCGSQANFSPNPGTTINVTVSVDNGTLNAPTQGPGFTAESNNLTLVYPSCPVGGAPLAPMLVFTETNTLGANQPAAQCPVITSITPPSGSNQGGTNVTINGFDFVPGNTEITFGGVLATNFSCSANQPAAQCPVINGITPPSGSSCSPTQCTATSPLYGNSSTTVPVQASANGITSQMVPADLFAYLPGPQCTSTLSCPAPGVTFPQLIVTCPSAFYVKNDAACTMGPTTQSVECGTNSDVQPPLLVCDPVTNSCSGYSLGIEAGYCGKPKPPPPLPPGDNCCTLCRKGGGLCTINPNGTCSACQ
jgi:hypothetical protein